MRPITMLRLPTVVTVTAALLLVAAPAWACGFLVAENGAVRLARTATLAAWEDGVEHYVTSFEFQGGGDGFGSIVPLPAEPHTVERAGSWTLQRLQREVTPVDRTESLAAEGASAAGGVEVLQQHEVDALDITILAGGGEAVLAWAREQGFDLGDGAAELLSFYAERSPYFMAARFDPGRAADLEQSVGDGTPIHLAMRTDDPWVPLRILAFDKPAEGRVEADVFLLTPDEPTLLPAGRDGLDVRASRPAGSVLLDDLRTDENSGWVPKEAWLTYVRVDVAAGDLTYDLAVDVDGGAPAWEAAFGAAAPVPELDVTGELPLVVAAITLGLLATAAAVSRFGHPVVRR